MLHCGGAWVEMGPDAPYGMRLDAAVFDPKLVFRSGAQKLFKASSGSHSSKLGLFDSRQTNEPCGRKRIQGQRPDQRVACSSSEKGHSDLNMLRKVHDIVQLRWDT